MIQLISVAVQAAVWLASNCSTATIGSGVIGVFIGALMRFMSGANQPQGFYYAPANRRRSWSEWMASLGIHLIKNMVWIIAAICFFKWPLTSIFMAIAWTGILYCFGLPSTIWTFAFQFVATLVVSAGLARLTSNLLHRASIAIKRAAWSLIKVLSIALVGILRLMWNAVCRTCRFVFRRGQDTAQYECCMEESGWWSDSSADSDYVYSCCSDDDNSVFETEDYYGWVRGDRLRKLERIDYTLFYVSRRN